MQLSGRQLRLNSRPKRQSEQRRAPCGRIWSWRAGSKGVSTMLSRLHGAYSESPLGVRSISRVPLAALSATEIANGSVVSNRPILGDLNGDGIVNGSDLAIVLGNRS